MRRSLACIATIVTGVGAAQAQSGPTVDWTGFYVGGSLGAVDGLSEPRTSVASSGTYFTTTDPEQIAGAGAGSLSQWRPAAGLHGGYSHQFGALVLGVELGASSLMFDDSRSETVGYLSAPGSSFTLSQTVEADWIATLRPRIGWAQDRWLAYLTGGVALTRLSVETTFTDNAFSAVSTSSDDSTEIGWTAGAGAEFALDAVWSVRGEYLFTDFGRASSTAPVAETFGGNAFLENSADLLSHSLMLGVSFRF